MKKGNNFYSNLNISFKYLSITNEMKYFDDDSPDRVDCCTASADLCKSLGFIEIFSSLLTRPHYNVIFHILELWAMIISITIVNIIITFVTTIIITYVTTIIIIALPLFFSTPPSWPRWITPLTSPLPPSPFLQQRLLTPSSSPSPSSSPPQEEM